MSKSRSLIWRALICAIVTLTYGCAKADTWAVRDMKEEFRGVWITNVDSQVLMSRESIAEAMEFLAEHNFNVVYPVVWNKGYTLYPSEIMQERFGKPIWPPVAGRDPLAEIIEEGHKNGLQVIPWFEFGFAAQYDNVGAHILETYPKWKAIDQNGELVVKNHFGWMNAFDYEVQEFMTSLILEVVNNYDVDGIQGDDRLPALPSSAGYDETTKAMYRGDFGVDPPTNIKDPQWVQWRADILTEYLADLRAQVKAAKPDVAISMAPSYYPWALEEYLQDSKTWVERGLVDAIHPQAYRYNLNDYKLIVDNLVANQFTEDQLDLLAPGILMNIGANYVISNDYLLGALEYNRQNGIPGEVFFFYEGLRKNDNHLAELLKDTYYARPARVPYN